MTLLKAGAVASSLVLLGGYVYLKATGGSVGQWLNQADAGSPAAVMSGSKSGAVQIDSPNGASQSTTVMAGSKSFGPAPVTITPGQISVGNGPKVQSQAVPTFQATEQQGLSYDVKASSPSSKMLGIGPSVTIAPNAPPPNTANAGATAIGGGYSSGVGGTTVSAAAASPALIMGTKSSAMPIQVQIPALQGQQQSAAPAYAQPGYGAGVNMPAANPFGAPQQSTALPQIGGGNPFGAPKPTPNGPQYPAFGNQPVPAPSQGK